MSETDFSRLEAQMQGKKDPAMPQFFTEPVKMDFKSKQEGRPIFEDREFVRIIVPGDRRSMVVEPVNDSHKERWPKEYAAYQEGREAPLEGTPLTEWPVSLMTPSRAQELAYFHIKTVEQLAALNDGQLQNLGMGSRELRDRAKTWLEVAAKGAAPIEKLISRVETLTIENTRLARELLEANTRNRALEQELKHARSAA